MSQFSIFGSSSSINNVAVESPDVYPYTVTSNNYAIIVDTTSARTINLPSSPSTGLDNLIKDGSGLSNSNPITIVANPNTIDGQVNYTIQQTYGWVGLLFNGVQWNVVNQ